MDQYKDNPADMGSFKDVEVLEKPARSSTQRRHKKAKVLGLSLLVLLVFGAATGAAYHLPPPQAGSKHEGARKRDTDAAEGQTAAAFLDPVTLINLAGALGAPGLILSSWLAEWLHISQAATKQKHDDAGAKAKQAHDDEMILKILGASKKKHHGH